MPRIFKLPTVLQSLLIIIHGLCLVLAFGHDRLEIPALLEFMGRMHPLILHFPIVLLLLLALLFWNPKLSLLDNPKFSNSLFLVTLVLTGLTVMAGLLLATEEGYVRDEFFLHQWTGIGLFWTATLWFAFWKKQQHPIARPLSVVTVIIIIVTGHLGASMTHGDDFLLAPFKKESRLEKVDLEEAISFNHVIQPILENKCISCHKASKQKGDLRLDAESYILAGGKNGPVIDVENPDLSAIIQRILLPLDDEEHMPPKGKAQLNAEETQLIMSWIEESAHFDKKLVSYPEESRFFQLAKNIFAEDEVSTYQFPPASTRTIEKLNHDYRVIQVLYPNSPALRAAFFGRSNFKSEQIDELADIKIQLVDLNLANMPLKDEDIRKLSNFTHLEKLNLNETGIKGDFLDDLKVLDHLTSLSLTGNRLDVNNIEKIGQLNQLEKLFIWNTGLDQSAVSSLKEMLPETVVETGFEDDGQLYQLNPPIIQGSSGLFQDKVEISIKHPIGNVSIFYTLDNSPPDSSNYILYEGPIILEKNANLRVRAFAKGWLGSEENRAVFFKAGVKPKSYNLTYAPHNSYKGKGVETLFDLEKGDEDFASGKWLGFKDTDCEIIMDFDNNDQLGSISLSLLSAEASYIFPPLSVEIWAKTKGNNWKLIHSERPEQPKQIRERKQLLLEYDLPDEKISQLKAVLKPINPLPKWHQGAGERGWVFIDEVLIN